MLLDMLNPTELFSHKGGGKLATVIKDLFNSEEFSINVLFPRLIFG
jgi:hypothetical protein